MIDAGEAIVVSIAARLYLRYEGIVETKGSILAFDTSVVIHCVVSLKDGILLARELLSLVHSSPPVLHLDKLGLSSFFEIHKLCCYLAQFVCHLHGRLHRIAFDCLRYLFETDCTYISQVDHVLSVNFLFCFIPFMLLHFDDCGLQSHKDFFHFFVTNFIKER